MDAKARLWDGVTPEPNSGCWLWTRQVSENGYAHFYYKGRTTYAHRAAYELYVGDIPQGYHVDHKCRVRSCCNPDHLEAVTPQENWRRSGAHRAASKRFCKRGHPWIPANWYIMGGRRQCKPCSRYMMNKWRRAQRAAGV